jgi:soluble lytic murein transglycosylase
MYDKAKLLDKMDSAKSATQLRQWMLDEYKNSESAAKLRWEFAEKAAKEGNYNAAWKWAQEITLHNPDSEIAAQAGFWVGKWAEKLGRNDDATTAYEYTLLRYPHSYYAWRSAVLLGWNVGDFTTVRSLSPEVVHPTKRDPLRVGSETLKELYQLGQEREAWKLWQVEFVNRREPSVAEQYVDGVLRIGVGDNLDGMWMLSSLSRREKPEEKAEYLQLKQTRTYWEALYPFPYMDTIVKWSKERQLNTVLVSALIRQESRFMPKIKSVVGATGLMQIMPETGKESARIINLVSYDLENVNDNVNIGTYYLGFTHREYDDNSMLAVASYNAGPNAVHNWLKRFGFNDADTFVEQIPYPETRGYVESVFENYWNYLQIYNPEISRLMAEHYDKNKK